MAAELPGRTSYDFFAPLPSTFVESAKSQLVSEPEEILTGFLDKDGNALGRLVGVAMDNRGALLVADDVGNTIWMGDACGSRKVKPSG
jgi:glucose/arabinose dehydrogenase